MNLIAGKYVGFDESLNYLNQLNDMIGHTLMSEALPPNVVIEACDSLSNQINEAEHLPLLMSLGMTEEKARRELIDVKIMMGKSYLENRMKVEFGNQHLASNEDVQANMFEFVTDEFIPYANENKVTQAWYPLGVLLHIAAGNIDALPVFSVIEGLLTGNINILKLPGSDDGLSIKLLSALIEIEPRLASFIYVFDYPSERIDLIDQMASVADAVVVWGGEAAVLAVRKLIKPNVKLIEWGHKVSFAYVSGIRISDKELEGIAFNMCDTNQLFCNSCQGIYLDTEDSATLMAFAERFSVILHHVSETFKSELSLFTIAQKTLEIETEILEMTSVYKSKGSSVIVRNDSELELSYMYRNCWVKPLPKDRLFRVLRPNKNYLQTAALICEDEDRQHLENLLFRAGLVIITDGKNMSKGYCGMPHDGDFPLRRYMKRVTAFTS